MTDAPLPGQLTIDDTLSYAQRSAVADDLRHAGIPTAPYGAPSMTTAQVTAALADTDEDSAP